MENPPVTKVCKKCQIEKSTTEYYYCKTKVYSICKECEKNRKKQQYSVNKDVMNAKHREYYNSNREKILRQKKSYYEENKPAIIARIMNKYKNDPGIKLYTHIRRRTRHFLKHGSIYSNIVQCSHDQLVKWFEFNFMLDSHWGMTFENFGKVWQIDHVYALSKLSLIPEDQHNFYYSWKNLRPVERRYNIAKSNKILEFDIKIIENRVKLFLDWYKPTNNTEDLDNIPLDSDDEEELYIINIKTLFE